MGRHARSRTWFALRAAHAQLVQELAAERYARLSDQLDIATVVGRADELAAQRDEAVRELAAVRRELQAARELASRPDPRVQMLSLEAAELRAAIAEQQRALAELTLSVVAVLERLVVAPSAPPRPVDLRPAAPAPVPEPRRDPRVAPAPATASSPTSGGTRPSTPSDPVAPETPRLVLADRSTDG